MKNLITLFTALIIFSTQAKAQNEALSFKNTWEIELDPIAYLLNGYSIHGIYNLEHYRIDLGVYGIEQPSSIVGNKDFKVKTTGFGLKFNYLIKKVNGFYVGIDAGYAANDIENKETKQKDISHNISIGAHLGYRLFLFPKSKSSINGIYLSPWAGAGYYFIYDKVKLSDYEERSLSYFFTLHLGYRF